MHALPMLQSAFSVHALLTQTPLSSQVSVALHAFDGGHSTQSGQLPPQSTPVSSLFFIWSEQCGSAQICLMQE